MKLGNNGLLAGIAGSSCCVLPFVLIFAGLGGSFLTVFFVNYKIYFMTFAGAVLIYSWVKYRREAKLCETQVCELAGGRLRKWMLGVNTAVVLFFFIITYTPAGALVSVDYVGENPVIAKASVESASGRTIPASTPTVSGSGPTMSRDGATRMERLTLRIEGMT